MIHQQAFELFADQSPVSVMARAALENAFSAGQLDEIFRRNAEQQREGDLPFSVVADIMSMAVLKIRPSVNGAYEQKKEELGVSINSIYNKLSGIEPQVSRAMVRDSAARLAEIQEAMNSDAKPLLAGYRTKILDGKHLNRTERRLAPLRQLNAAPLPGQALAVLDGDRRLVEDVILCEDAHAQERSLLDQVLLTVQRDDLWIGDRNFCTVGFADGIAEQQARFLLRRHSQTPLETSGAKKRVGTTATGTVYEQQGWIDPAGNQLAVRVVTVKLKQPTRDDESEIVLLTNLPKKVSARRVAELYRGRWTIETAFQQIAQALHGEIDTLAYPKAALFGFCIALVAYNLLSMIKTAIATAHHGDPAELSSYYIADEIRATYYGMMIVLPPDFWHSKYGALSAAEMAQSLLKLAQQVSWKRFRKHGRSTKKPPPDVGPKTNRNHVSTKRVLDEYQEVTC